MKPTLEQFTELYTDFSLLMEKYKAKGWQSKMFFSALTMIHIEAAAACSNGHDHEAYEMIESAVAFYKRKSHDESME